MRTKRDIILPKLKNANGDMNADWYVEFSVRNPESGKMERKRIYTGFKEIETYEARMEHGNKLVEEYTNRIRSGEISTEKMVEYEDELMFDTNTFKSRKRLGKENTFRVLASDFIVYKRSEVNKKSMQSYKSKLRAFENYLNKYNLHDKNITVIDNYIFIDFLKELAEDKDLSRLTIEKYQQMLHSFFLYVIKSRRIKMENPTLNVPRMGKVVDESAPGLSPEIRRKLQRKIEIADPQLWLGCSIMYYTAIRPGTEMRLIQLKNINLESKTITIRNFLAKNARTETVDIPGQLYKLLLEWNLHNYDQDLYLFGKEGLPGDKPIGKNSLRMRFNKYRDELGLSKEIKFYSWKHSGASELKDAGANMYDIQRHFRHQSVSTTEKYWRKRLGGSRGEIKNKFPDI
ncbi:MAG: site-specific integrase [Tissierellia bacterium]|nr:site-specific integrase [Tissierellia bacterium]